MVLIFMKHILPAAFILIAFLSGGCKRFKLPTDKHNLRSVGSVGASDADASIFIMPDKIGAPLLGGDQICDTELPVVQQGVRLSNAYLNNCAGCHGSAGEGSKVAPGLGSVASLDLYKETVRSGRNAMPKFVVEKIADEDLAKDFELLKSKADQLLKVPTLDVPVATVGPIDEEQYQQTMKRGLLAWRTPGARGACAACHGPDGIDLARVAYSNAAMLRRAMGQGLNPKAAMDIVDMIAAQRARYQMRELCNVDRFRPMQPGFKVLSGATAQEKDLLLLDKLIGHGVNLEVAALDTAESSSTMASVIAKLDVKNIPIAVPLTRWGEDEFNGSDHKSTSEWLPELPLEPSSSENAKKWIELQNAYLQSYGVTELWNMLDGVSLLDSARFSDGGVGARLAKEKFKSVLIMQHMLREKNFKFPDLVKTANPNRFAVWETAQIANVMTRGCADAGSATETFPCWDYPESFYKKMGTDSAFLLRDIKKISAPWLVTGLLQDPALQLTEGGDAQMLHLHEALNAAAEMASAASGKKEDLFLHHIYFGLLRMVKSVDGLDSAQPIGKDLSTKAINGCWDRVNAGMEQWSQATLMNLKTMGLLDKDKFTDQAYRGRIIKVVHGANKMLLQLVLNGLSHKKAECSAMPADQHLTMQNLVDAVYGFEKELDAPGAQDLDATVAKIKSVLAQP